MTLMLQSVKEWERGKAVGKGFVLLWSRRINIEKPLPNHQEDEVSVVGPHQLAPNIHSRSREVACIRFLLAISALAIFSTGTYPAAYLHSNYCSTETHSPNKRDELS